MELTLKSADSLTIDEKAEILGGFFMAHWDNMIKIYPRYFELLEKRGRIAVISFHSLEDKIVKEMFINFQKQNMGKIITKKPVIAKEEEIQKNARSKSAKLRVFEKN